MIYVNGKRSSWSEISNNYGCDYCKSLKEDARKLDPSKAETLIDGEIEIMTY